MYLNVNNGDTMYSLLSFASSILMIISMWMIFEKAGEAGWKSLIPFYNDYILCKIANAKKLFIIKLISSIVVMIASFYFIFALIALILLGKEASFGTIDYTGVGASWIMSLIVMIIAAIVNFIISIIVNINLAKAFNKESGFAVGLILLPVVFYPILAFSKDIEYNRQENNLY